MMISILLGRQIAAMLLMVFMGWLVVRLKLLTVRDSKAFAALTLYLVGPCMILDAFQVDYTPDKLKALLLSITAGTIAQLLCLLFDAVLRRPLKLDAVERTSSIYTNSGNLIIPIVSYVLGGDWVLFTCGYMMFQTVLFWTHCVTVLKKDAIIDLRKILLNINVICIFAGLVLFATGFRLPEVPRIAVHSIGIMIGPISMLVTGMLIGEVNFKRLAEFRRLPLIVFLRLIAYPLLTLGALRLAWRSGLLSLSENDCRVLLIVFLAAAAPCASTVTQMAHLYGRNGEYASLINVMSTLLCVITMPALVFLFQLLIH